MMDEKCKKCNTHVIYLEDNIPLCPICNFDELPKECQLFYKAIIARYKFIEGIRELFKPVFEFCEKFIKWLELKLKK